MRVAQAENGCLLFSYCSVSIVFSYHSMGNREQHEDYLRAAVSAAATIAAAPLNKIRLLHLGWGKMLRGERLLLRQGDNIV